MNSTVTMDFQKYWDKFEVRLRGQLIQLSQKGILTDSSAELALSSCLEFWEGQYSEGKRWIDKLSDESVEKAESVRSILINDMCFESKIQEEKRNDQSQKVKNVIEKAKNKEILLKYGIAVGGGLSGLVLSNICGASVPVKAIVTTGAVLLTYPLASNAVSSSNNSFQKEMIEELIGKLNKYKLSVESVLNYN